MVALDQVWRSSTRAGLAVKSLSLRSGRSRIRSEEESMGIPSLKATADLFSLAPLSLLPPLWGRVGDGGGRGRKLLDLHRPHQHTPLALRDACSLEMGFHEQSACGYPPPQPSPTLPHKGGGSFLSYCSHHSVFVSPHCVFATRGGVAVVMNCVASSIAVPRGVGITIRNGTRMRVPATGAKAISMLRWAVRYLITGRSGM
jgi:hypothetical protein